jgi:hypothetical protein
MKPLQSVAMGMVIVVLAARFNGYDALADPFGWLLVWLGVHALPAAPAHRNILLGLSALAGAVSSVLWFPQVADDLYAADASLAWAANLPQLLLSAFLCHFLAALAAAAGDPGAVTWMRFTRAAMVVIALLPVLVFGAGLESYEQASYVAAAFAGLLLIWLLFAYGSRTWANPIRETRAHSGSAS